MKNKIQLIIVFLLAYTFQAQEKTVPVFKDGEAQIVAAFNDPEKWIRHDLCYKTRTDKNRRFKVANCV